jgi:hypothetical protein
LASWFFQVFQVYITPKPGFFEDKAMKKLLLAMTLLLLTFGPSQASTLGIDFSSSSGFDSASRYVLGWEFTVSAPITVDALGALDRGGDGFAYGPQQVGLWKTDGTLLASVSVTSDDPLTSWWRFADITPITLEAGESYIVASQGGEGYLFFANGTTAPGVTYVQDRHSGDIGTPPYTELYFPNYTDSYTVVTNAGYFGGNFMMSAVPVPPSVFLLGSGLLGLVGWRRFRKS